MVENELYKIEFTNRGAQVKSWILKQYKDSDGKPLNLVHTQAAEKFGYPLSLHTYDAATNTALASALYVPSATGSLMAPAKLTFQYSGDGLEVTKTFSFDETYVLHADIEVRAAARLCGRCFRGPAVLAIKTTRNPMPARRWTTRASGTEEHIAPKKVSGGETLNGPFDWAGVSDTYFAAIFLPDSPATATLATLHNELDVAKTIHRTGFGADLRPRGRSTCPFWALRLETPAVAPRHACTLGRRQPAF